MSIDLQLPTSAFSGAHIQNTTTDVSLPIAIVINPQPSGNPSPTGIFDALKDAARNMLFRLENKSVDGQSFLALPELRLYAGTYTQFELDGFEIRSDGQTPATWGIYHRKSDGTDAAGNALAGYVYKNVVYGFDLEHKFPGFQSMVQASRQAKLTAANFIDAADLNHTTGQQHKKVSPLTEADALASLEVYECTDDGDANVESNTLRIKPGAESADKTLTYDGGNGAADLSGAITAAALGPFADAVKTKLDANKSTIQFDTLVQRTKNIQSIAANAHSTANQEIKVQHADKFPKSNQDITGAVFNATAATMPLTIGAATLPSNNGLAPSQALAFKASIGTAATARVETVTIEDKEYGTPAVRNTQLLLLNQARFAAQTTSEAMPETTLTVAAVDTTPKTVTVKVGNGQGGLITVIDAKTYNTAVAASGSLTFRNVASWGNAATRATTQVILFHQSNSGGTTNEIYLTTAAGDVHTISSTGTNHNPTIVQNLIASFAAIQAAGNLSGYTLQQGPYAQRMDFTGPANGENFSLRGNSTLHGRTGDTLFTTNDPGVHYTNGSAASNSNLTITVQGYAEKQFAIGPVAGGYSTTAGLANAVAAAFDAENGLSAVSNGDTVTFSKTTGDFAIDTNSVNNAVTTGTTTQQTNNFVAAGDYTSATALASAIQTGINNMNDIHADLDPDGNGDNTIVNIRGTKKTNGSMDFTQTIPIQITQTPTTATGLCDAFDNTVGAGAFPSGMTHTVFGSDLSTGSGFEYSVRINGEDSGGTVTVAANKADVDAVLNDIHTAFNTYKGNNATKWTRAEKVLLEGKFDGPADLTKKIALADSSGDISGGSATEKLCLFDFEPVIGNKATASGDFTTAADSVSAAFKGKVKLGGFVALCDADNTVLSYLEVIPGYVVEGNGANAAKLESYDTSANPFLTKINGASAEVTVDGVADGPVVFNTNKTVGFHANDTTSTGASRIGSALIKEGVIAAFEKGSVTSGNFTQAYTQSTIRVYYADATATASLTHDDGNNDVIKQTNPISALQFAVAGADTLTIRSSHDSANSSVSVTVGPDGSRDATNAATAAAKFVELFNANNGAKMTAGKIASVAAGVKYQWSQNFYNVGQGDHAGYDTGGNPGFYLQIKTDGAYVAGSNGTFNIIGDAVTMQADDWNQTTIPANASLAGMVFTADAANATMTITHPTKTFTVKVVRPLVLSDETIIAANTEQNSSAVAVPGKIVFTGIAEGADAVDFTLKKADNSALDANPLVAATTTAFACTDANHETVTLQYGTGASAKSWEKTIGKAPKYLANGNLDDQANHFLTPELAKADFYTWATTGDGSLVANITNITTVADTDARTVTISGEKASGAALNTKSFQFTKTGDGSNNVTAATTAEIIGTESTNDITFTITATDESGGNSTSKTIRCGHSTNITKKTVDGVDSLHCNTAANIRDYIVDAVCDLGAMIGSKATNGANVTLSGRANGKSFVVTITATESDGTTAVDITAGNHLSVGDLVVGTNIGQITYTVASEHGIFDNDSVTLKPATHANVANNGTFNATRVSATEFSVVLTNPLSHTGFTNSKFDNNATRNVKLQFKKGNDTGTEQTIALTGTAQNVRDAIVTALNAEGVKNEGSKGYASAVAAKDGSDDTLVITSTAPTSFSDDQTFIIKVTDDANVDAILQNGDANGEISVSALGSTLFNTTVIDVGADHGISANDVVTVAGTTNNDLATKVVVAVGATTISLAETGTEQQAAGGTVKVHNLLDMTMQNTLGLSLKNGAALKLGPATVFDEVAHTAANFDVNATMKDVIQEFWTYTKNDHGLEDGDIVQQLSETGFEVEIARGVFTRTNDNSGTIRQVKGRFETNDAFVLKKSTGGGAFAALSSSASTELALTSNPITGATKGMFRKLQDGTEMDTQGKFEVGNYYVLNTGVQVLKAAITGTNDADFGLNTNALGIQKEYDFKLEAGALTVLSGPAAQADVLKSGIITFTVSSGMYEGDFGTGVSQVIQFVLKHDGATGTSNDANWGYYSNGTSPDNTQTKTLFGLTKLNTGSTVATNGYSISFHSGNKLDGSGTFSSASNASVTMKNSNNDEIEFGTATFAKSTTTTGAIDMTLNLDKNTFLLDSDMEFEFTLKLVADNIPAGIPTEDATVYVLYKFTNFQKPYALHSNQDLANRATWRTLSDTANASIADFSMIGETFKAVNDNFYVASRTQAQLLDIDGLTWAYDDTAGAEKYTASISLSDAKSVQISNYGRLGADIHTDLRMLKGLDLSSVATISSSAGFLNQVSNSNSSSLPTFFPAGLIIRQQHNTFEAVLRTDLDLTQDSSFDVIYNTSGSTNGIPNVSGGNLIQTDKKFLTYFAGTNVRYGPGDNELYQNLADSDFTNVGLDGAVARAEYATTTNNNGSGLKLEFAIVSDGNGGFKVDRANMGGGGNLRATRPGFGYAAGDQITVTIAAGKTVSFALKAAHIGNAGTQVSNGCPIHTGNTTNAISLDGQSGDLTITNYNVNGSGQSYPAKFLNAGNSFEVPVQVDFLNKAVKGGFTKKNGDDQTLHYSDLSFTDEVRDSDSVKIHTLEVAYTAADKIDLTIKCDDVDQKALNQISDAYPANMSTNRKAPFGASSVSGKITQLVSMDGVAIAAGNLANAANLPMTSGNFQLQIDSEGSSVALTSTTTQANIDGKKRLTVDGDISLNNALAIAAGTQIIFQNNTSKLTGALTCTGTATDPIVFQSGNDSIDDVGKGAPGRESNWKSVSLAAGSNCNGCVFLGGGNDEAGTVITNGAVTMTNCAIFNSAAKSISVASGSSTLDFITVGNNATDAPDVSPTNLITLTAGVMFKTGSGTDTFAAANREWFAVQNRVDMHLSYAKPTPYVLTKNADQGAGAFIFYRSSLAGGINVFRMNSSSKSSVARGVSLYNPALVTLDQAADLSFARRTAFTDQTIGTLKLDGAPLSLKDGSIPAGIYVYLDKENTQGSLKRNLDTGVIQLSRSATDIPSQVTVKVSNSNRGIFDVDSKDDLAPIHLTYTEDPNLEVKHHEKVVNPFRKVIEGGDYTGAIDVAGMTQVIIDGPVVLKTGASLAFDANTDVVMIERDRTVTTGVLSMRADELLASVTSTGGNTGFTEGTYYADLSGGNGSGGKVKLVVGADGIISDLDVTHQGSGYAKDEVLTVASTQTNDDGDATLGKILQITLTADDVVDVYPYDMSGIIENGGEVSFGAGCVVRTNTDYQLSKANNAKVLGMVCGSTTNPTKRFYINRELVSLAVEAPTGGNAANMFFVPCRMGSCDEATLSQPLSHANRLTDAIRLPATVDDYSCTDVALVDQALTINATKTLRVEPGARLVGHKSIAEKIAGSAMGAKTVTVTGTLQCLGFDSTNAAELHGLNVAGAGSIQLRHALVTLLGDTDKIDFNTADADSFIDRVEIKATASASRAAGLNFGANLNTRASVLEARQIKMDGAPIQVETSNLLLQDCDVLNIDSSKYGVKVTTYGSTIRKIRVNGEKLVEGATGTLLNTVQNGTFMKDVEQGIVGASEGAFENDLVIHNVAAAAFNARARLYAEKEANDNSIALTKSLTAANGFVDDRADAALAAYNNERAGFGGAAIADRAAFRAAIAMEGAADYFMHVGQTFDKDVDQLAVKESTTKMAELFLGHMILNGELLSRVEVALSVESATADVFDDDSLTRIIVAATEKCTFKGTLATTAFTFTQKPILLVNGGLRDAQSTQSDPHATNAAATNSAVAFDGFNTYATLGNQTMNYASVAGGNLDTPAKKRVLVSQSDLLTVTINADLDGTSTYKYDPIIIQSEYGRLDKGAYNLARSAGDLTYVGIFGSRGDVALTANDNHVAILHTLGNAASGTLNNTYIEDCTGHAIAGAGVLNARVECVDYQDRLCSGDITQNGAVLYAESEKAPRGSEATQFGGTNDVTDIQAPHQAFFTLPNAGSSFGAISDANRFAHWWNPLKTFTAAYQFQGLGANSSQDIVYGYLQAEGTPAILNGGEAARLSATQIGTTKFYELKKAAATAGAPKVHYKTAGSNAVEVSMAAEVTMAAAAAGTPTTQNSSDANATTKRTDRTANGDTIALQAAQLTLDDAALWGAKKQVVTATPPSGSYNELLLPANDAVEGLVQFASQKSIPTGDYVFKRIEYAVAKDLQYGAQGSMNPSPRGFTVSDTQTLTVTVEQQPKLQLFAKGAGAEAQLDTDRIRILRHSQLNAGAGGDIKAIVRVNIVNPDTIANISVIDPANQPKFTASNTKVVSVAGQHAAADATGQTLVLKLNETAGAYSGANNGLTVQNVMEGEVANSEFGTQSVTIKSVTDIATVDIDGTYFDTNNNNTHLVCRNKWYDLPAQNVRSIAVNVTPGTRTLAGDSRCTITATETLGNTDTLTDFIGDWVWAQDTNSSIDTLTGTLSLPAQSETFGSGANTALNGNQNFSKPVVIIEGEVTITGNVVVGANVDQILFKDNANLIITGDLTIDRDDLAKPVLVRHIDDHTLQFCQGEFKGIDVAGNGNIKGLMIVGGTNQLKVGGGTLGGDTAAKGIRLINGCEKALRITGELSGHCQNVYIRGAKVGLLVSGTTAATELKDIRIDDCLNNALTLNSAVSIGNIFVNSASEPRDTGMFRLMGTGAVTLLASTTQYMAADTRNQGSLTGITSWTSSAGDSEGTGQFLLRVNDPIFSNVTFDFSSVLSAGDSFTVFNKANPGQATTVADKTDSVGNFTVDGTVGTAYVSPLETTGLVDNNFYVLSVGNPVASGLVNSASTPVVNYDQAAGADRMATLSTMGYVPAKDISTTAQVQYKEEYSHYYTDANMTASARTSTDATNSYKIQTKEYMQGLRFSANQYTATKSAGNTADISGNANKVHKDATLAWANNALTALQVFTGTSTRAADTKTSIAKATSTSITMPTIANNPDEYDLETLAVAAKYDFARLKINATPATTSAKETKSASYSMFSTLAVYGDAPQFRILSKDSGADTNYIGGNAHNWLFAGSTVSGAGSCSPMVVLTFGGDMPSGLEYDIPVAQSGGAGGRVYGIDNTNKKLLVGEVTGTFVTTENVLVNGTDSSQAPTVVDKDNRLMKTADVTMGFVLNEAGNYVDIDFNEQKNAGITAPQTLSYTMQNEAYLSVLDAHPFGIGDKRHANYTFGTTDGHVMETHGSNYLSRSGPTFANDGEIVITQKDTIDLPDNDNTNDLINVGSFSMPNAMTLSGIHTALSLQNLTNALAEVRGCIRPHLHSTFTAAQAETEKSGYSSTFTTAFNRLVPQANGSIATMKISPALTDGTGGTNGFAVIQGGDAIKDIDFIQVYGTAPAAYTAELKTQLKDGYILEFDRGLQTDLVGHQQTDVTITFATNGANSNVVISGLMSHGLLVNAFVKIKGAAVSAGNKGTFRITAVTDDTFTIVNAAGVAETQSGRVEEIRDLGLEFSDQTTLSTRALTTTLACRPGLKYKTSFGDSGANGTFTYSTQYFPKIQLDPTYRISVVAGVPKMIDGLGTQCDDNTVACKSLNQIISQHASYIGPMGGMCLVEQLSVTDFSTTMEKTPKLFKLPEQQLDNTHPQGRTGTLEIVTDATARLNGFKAKFVTDCCIYVRDESSQYALKTANAAHADSQSIGVLQKVSDSTAVLKVGDTITDGDGNGSGIVQKIVITKLTSIDQTIQIQMSTTTDIKAQSAQNDTLKVGSNVVFTHENTGGAISWTIGSSYYTGSSRPIADGHMVLFADKDNAGGKYGVLKAAAWDTSNKTMIFTRTNDAQTQQERDNERIPSEANLADGDRVLFFNTQSSDVNLSGLGDATFVSGHQKDGENNKFKVVEQTSGEHPDKLLIMGLSTHGIRTNSNGVYENASSTYFLHMRMDDTENGGSLFLNKVVCIKTDLVNPYSMMRTTTVGSNSSADLQMSNVIRGTQKEVVSGYTTRPYQTKELEVVGIDMSSSNADKPNNPAHWGGSRPTTRTQDLSGILIVNPDELTEHGSPYVQNADAIHGALQALKRPSMGGPSDSQVQVTGVNNTNKVTFAFTNHVALPVDGKIVLTVPSTFTFAAEPVVESLIDGGFTAATVGNIITITRNGAGTATAANTTASITVTATALGATGTDGFEIYTTDSSGTILESDFKSRAISIQ